MALGRRENERQQDFWVATTDLPRSEGHAFYEKLNKLLREVGFDEYVETLCQPHYHDTMGRPGIPPGIYFRMLLVGYFEGIGSQRGIAWRCGDSLSLREFLSIPLSENTPDHSSLTRVRDRLPLSIHQQVFQFVLQVADAQGLLKGKTAAVDATTLEANAAMKSIVRRDTGEDWHAYIGRLMQEAGEIEAGDEPSVEEIARFDRQRKDKKTSNQEWQSQTDPDSRITKMKDGRTHLAYKAEHTIDLETELILAAEVHHANEADAATIGPSLATAQGNVIAAQSDANIEEAVADKGYYKNETLAELEFTEGLRTYIAEPKFKDRRNWKNKPEEQRQAVTNNRRRTKGNRGRALQRLRSERVERSFAHVCGTGGSRRTWLRSIEKVRKRYLMSAMARNLGLVMRSLFGFGTARSLQAEGDLACGLYFAWVNMQHTLSRLHATNHRVGQKMVARPAFVLAA
ncbi:transposase [Bythopirellula polymerisocia]|uniref:Transposase DDE domain protein n=1 Tax=Bythopirellula polymerisocia TaxID=2528003 RepID=A0A5C6CUU0_9BACT|nr:transposase [Bythopirellula polymerisocia]TWU27414.1 Transposase DDE domain protein [Bythopirellula polymerisocia]